MSFPILLAIGVPALNANVTSTVGIFPGYLGGAVGFRRELAQQRDRVRSVAAVALTGGVAGAILLLVTPGNAFKAAAPYLILVSCGLFAAQPFLAARLERADGRSRWLFGQAGIFVACVYGAYFGAGLGVLLLAVLGITMPDKLSMTSGLRTAISLAVNLIAAIDLRRGCERPVDLRRDPRRDKPRRRLYRGAASRAESHAGRYVS